MELSCHQAAWTRLMQLLIRGLRALNVLYQLLQSHWKHLRHLDLPHLMAWTSRLQLQPLLPLGEPEPDRPVPQKPIALQAYLAVPKQDTHCPQLGAKTHAVSKTDWFALA